ncbi:hydroxymethylglutaryl-CoA lyase [Thermodesulfovibrionales bacterium]|nr:hydroxymethylglutaryl-CoA lyase [Thermodesulfovibrionales bacterium]
MRISIVEVGPRDGLQNIKKAIATKDKIAYIHMLAAAGCARIETTAFVHPRLVPQLADSAELYKAITKQETTSYAVLIPNLKGLNSAIESKVQEVAVFIGASETFNRKNTNVSTLEMLHQIKDITSKARQFGIPVRGYVATGFACPFEGEIPVQKTVELTEKLLDMGVYEVSVGDTIGVAIPADVERLLKVILSRVDDRKIALHMHDTRGISLANVLRALEMGITTFDTSAGGLGGCPFAPGAAGNLATEDLVYVLNKMGLETGINLDKLVQASQFMEQLLGYPLPSKCLQAMKASC